MERQRSILPGGDDGGSRFLDIPEDDKVHWDTPRRLQWLEYRQSAQYLRHQEWADWQNTDRRLAFWAAKLVDMAWQRDIPLAVHSAFRTEAEQQALVAKGASKAPYPRSAHNIGEAVDIIHGRYGWNLSEGEWQLIYVLGGLALNMVNNRLKAKDKLKLNWGGDDGTPQDTFRWDPAHWEIEDYRSRIRRLPVGTPIRHSTSHILSTTRL